MIQLTKEQIILMHERLIIRYGGSHGVRDEALLDSAVSAPYQTFDGKELYPTILQKAVRLCYYFRINVRHFITSLFPVCSAAGSPRYRPC